MLHAAGPFASTALPMLEACLRTRTHYLDIAGELTVFQAVRRQDAEARAVQLRAHPLAQIVEPDRVFCGACEKWVKLGQYAYYLHHWTQHLNTVHAPDRQYAPPPSQL